MAFFDNPQYDYKDAKFTSINVPMFLTKPIIKNALRKDGESEELINLIKKISDVKVMTVESGNEAMVSDYAKYLTNNNYEEWMTVRKEKETIKFQAKQNGEEIRKLLITIASGTELVYVDISGKFTADDLSRIINYSEKNDVKKLVSK
jgi:23S rRNA pseudoU1915 N3-methylase RlmH